MSNPEIAIPTREPAATSADDTVMPFEVAALDLRGRVVRLGPVVDQILTRHAYPVPVAKLLGEAVVLTIMLGSALKIDGRFILQTQTDGPVRMLVVDFTTPGKVRACARFDKDRVAAAIAAGKADAGALLGKGHLAMTIDQGADTSRYQGLVALDGGTLEDAAHEYFLRSEQIPTRVRLAVAEELRAAKAAPAIAGAPAASCCNSCRSRRNARALPISIPAMRRKASCRTRCRKTTPGCRAARLLETVEDVELIDPEVSSERLVYRLFHEPGVRVFRGSEVRAECSCSRDSVEAMLKSFSQDDRDHMVEDGKISVTCEFCSANYVFAPGEVEAKAKLMKPNARGAAGSFGIDRAACGAGAKLSGAAGVGAPAGARHRRYVHQHHRDRAAFRARRAECAVAVKRRPGDGPDRPQRRRLGACVSRIRAQRRAGEGGRRQARAGGFL